MRSSQTSLRAGRLAAAVCLAAAILGCSTPGPAVGDVSGKVTFKGKAVTEGSVTFLNPKEGGTAGADIGPDGTYTITNVTAGEYLVVVTPRMVMMDTDPGKSPPAPVEKAAPNIPIKYRQQGTTPLKFKVEPGKSEFNIEMLP